MNEHANNRDADRETRECRECGDAFVILKGEAEWLIAKGLSLPTRCKPCRQYRRRELGNR